MKHSDSGGVRALVALDSAELQISVMGAFEAAGIPEPLTADDAVPLRERLAESELDLIVMSSGLQGVYVAPMISEIRRGRLGPHPFPIVIVVTHETEPAAIRQISNCGPDDIIPLPCTPQDLLDRIGVFLAGGRKPLVVNEGYAGPERRTANRGV